MPTNDNNSTQEWIEEHRAVLDKINRHGKFGALADPKDKINVFTGISDALKESFRKVLSLSDSPNDVVNNFADNKNPHMDAESIIGKITDRYISLSQDFAGDGFNIGKIFDLEAMSSLSPPVEDFFLCNPAGFTGKSNFVLNTLMRQRSQVIKYPYIAEFDSYAHFNDPLIIRKITERGLTNSQSRNINNNKHNQKSQLQMQQANEVKSKKKPSKLLAALTAKV